MEGEEHSDGMDIYQEQKTHYETSVCWIHLGGEGRMTENNGRKTIKCMQGKCLEEITPSSLAHDTK